MPVDIRGELRDEFAAVSNLPNEYEWLVFLFDHAELRSLGLELRNPVIPGTDASSSPGHLAFQAFLMVPILRIRSTPWGVLQSHK